MVFDLLNRDRRLGRGDRPFGVIPREPQIDSQPECCSNRTFTKIVRPASQIARVWFFLGVVLLVSLRLSLCTPANKSALKRHYDAFLSESLNRCTSCHLPSDKKNPETLDEFPHNEFGKQLRSLAAKLDSKSISARLKAAADDDADGDGVPNEAEILLGRNPGDPKDTPEASALKTISGRAREFAQFLNSYRWEPFQTVKRPTVPETKGSFAHNEIDHFIAAGHEKHKLKPRPEASREVLMRRAYIDLIGLSPSPEERRRFLADRSSDAYERLVDRLLEDPRYGERWGRHWMDIWRYSDWAGWSGGNQIRDSKPHIWRWRDWIIESLNEDKGYDQMVREMLAADELLPDDTNAVRATGFLVRNYKMLSREQWLEDTVKHSSQAFLGVTIGCAKCHNHMTDPISQAEYYEYRAIFEPHDVRTDRVPGELDRGKDGLVRAYDVGTNRLTYFFLRGDERKPDTNRVMQPGVPKAFQWGNDGLVIQPVSLPKAVAQPDRRDFVLKDSVATADHASNEAKERLAKAAPDSTEFKEAELAFAAAEAKHGILQRQLRFEELDDTGAKEAPERVQLASSIAELQKKSSLLDAKLALHRTQLAERKALAKPEKKSDIDSAKKRRVEAEKALAAAQKDFEKGWGTDFSPRPVEKFPETSTGRRAAFAKWLTDNRNPLVARVAVNHMWLRHFGRGLVATPENFGALGAKPSHPELLDWLAAEFMAEDWSMKALHRKILTSATYRMASTSDEANAAIDPDNIYLWRMPSRRIDAELVRDNLLWSAGDLDTVMGGPDIDNNLGLSSKRRSIYLRIAAEKEVEFLKIFDGPAVTECYQRRSTVMPQQALALGNSKIAFAEARSLVEKLGEKDAHEFISSAYERVLARLPSRDEHAACADFLEKQGNDKSARENLALVLFNHNDFVTVR